MKERLESLLSHMLRRESLLLDIIELRLTMGK